MRATTEAIRFDDQDRAGPESVGEPLRFVCAGLLDPGSTINRYGLPTILPERGGGDAAPDRLSDNLHLSDLAGGESALARA